MGLFGFVGSVVKGVAKGAACVAAAPVVVGVGAAVAVGATAVTIAEEVVVPIGKGVLKISGALAKEILKNAADTVANAYKYQQKGAGMEDAELLDAYKNSKSPAERVGYASALKSRMNR